MSNSRTEDADGKLKDFKTKTLKMLLNAKNMKIFEICRKIRKIGHAFKSRFQ